MSDRRLWYIKRGEQVKGPFPSKVVRQHLLLGRYLRSDLVSQDAKQWHRLEEVEELVPPLMDADPDDTEAQEQLAAVTRWADERLAIDRRTASGPTEHPDRRGVERREEESVEALSHREAKTGYIVEGRNKHQRQLGFLVVVLVLVAGVLWWVSGLEPTPLVAPSDCSGAPAPGIDWNSCQLRGSKLYRADLRGIKARSVNLSTSDMERADFTGADLAYADMTLANITGAKLSNAKLVGVDFQRSILANADLSGSDAAYANFFNTDISGASFKGTRLDRAVWINGVICADGSTGECIPTNEMVR